MAQGMSPVRRDLMKVGFEAEKSRSRSEANHEAEMGAMTSTRGQLEKVRFVICRIDLFTWT